MNILAKRRTKAMLTRNKYTSSTRGEPVHLSLWAQIFLTEMKGALMNRMKPAPMSREMT